ncbi:hypothetical protein QAD02_001330 [Eretmocerus hayati]|uniref:Uncharacterized protein n=1 Tax=Eretmocerus hayati TaxID=131215 RepID=A0ACC2NG52_9HYME|nr:hypothetical protein QAD02_001330 [Eretmocerus hayati]
MNQSRISIAELLSQNAQFNPEPIGALLRNFQNCLGGVGNTANFHCDTFPPDQEENVAWLNQKSYENNKVTVGEAVERTLKFFLENFLTKKALGQLLELYFALLPSPDNKPKTRFLLD